MRGREFVWGSKSVGSLLNLTATCGPDGDGRQRLRIKRFFALTSRNSKCLLCLWHRLKFNHEDLDVVGGKQHFATSVGMVGGQPSCNMAASRDGTFSSRRTAWRLSPRASGRPHSLGRMEAPGILVFSSPPAFCRSAQRNDLLNPNKCCSDSPGLTKPDSTLM